MEVKFSADPRIKGDTELVQATPPQANSGSFLSCVGWSGRLSERTLEMSFSTRSWNEKSVGEVDATVRCWVHLEEKHEGSPLTRSWGWGLSCGSAA